MKKPADKRRRHTWYKFVIIVVCFLIGRGVLRIPRATWSAKGSPRGAAIAEEATSEFLPFSNERHGEGVMELAEGWLAEHQADEFLLFVHHYDPHFPYVWHKDTRFKFPFLFPSQKDMYV